MKSFLFPFQIAVNSSQFPKASDAAEYLDFLNEELIKRGYTVTSSSLAKTALNSESKGPLEKEWCEKKNVQRVRCTNGRSPEEQAEYNLRHYLNYKDEQISALKVVETPLDNESFSLIEENDEVPEDKLF
jgi:hypothetical protein